MADFTMNKLKIAGIPGYDNAIGQKKPENTGLTPEELMLNMILPFDKQHPVVITENCETGKIEYDAKIEIARKDIVLTLGKGSYNGQRLVIVAGFSEEGTAKIILEEGKEKAISAGRVIEYFWNQNHWTGGSSGGGLGSGESCRIFGVIDGNTATFTSEEFIGVEENYLIELFCSNKDVKIKNRTVQEHSLIVTYDRSVEGCDCVAIITTDAGSIAAEIGRMTEETENILFPEEITTEAING